MIKKVKKKTCSKAKREKEILHDLEILDRQIKIHENWLSGDTMPHEKEHIAHDLHHMKLSRERLERKLRDLWTEPGTKKKRAKAGGDRS